MLFKDDNLNSQVYSIGCYSDSFSKGNLCAELFDLTEKITEIIDDGQIIELRLNDLDDNPYTINSVSELVYSRSKEDIYRILFSKKEFKNKLALLNIEEPIDKTSINYLQYLQCMYFFYIMDYFVFPDVRFFDLFKESNWSSENVPGSNTGNEKYQLFIENYFYTLTYIKDLAFEYEKKYQDFQECFYSYYELKNAEFIQKEKLEGIRIKDKQTEFNEFINYEIEEMNDIAFKYVENNHEPSTVFEKLISSLKSYEAKATLNDAMMNIPINNYEDYLKITEYLAEIIPSSYNHVKIYEEELMETINCDSFKCLAMNKKHMNPTYNQKYDKYDIYSVIKKIWEYEKEQMKLSVDGAGIFFFLQKDDNSKNYMTLKDILLIACVRIQLPYQHKYETKRLYLKNRSNGQKQSLHSISESYKVIPVDDFDVANSTLRDYVFRVICRFIFISLRGYPEEFYLFEVPMNIKEIQTAFLPEQFDSLDKKIKWFDVFIELMEENTSHICISDMNK